MTIDQLRGYVTYLMPEFMMGLARDLRKESTNSTEKRCTALQAAELLARLNPNDHLLQLACVAVQNTFYGTIAS